MGEKRPKNEIFKMLKRIINNTPIIKTIFSPRIVIFILHRVAPPEPTRLTHNETSLKITPQYLEDAIIKLKSKGYEFISLDRVYEILTKEENVRKKAVITFDDGYKDNYTIAYPILKKHNIPFCIYITTAFPERNGILWWYVLEDIILENDVIKLSNGQTFECKSKTQKDQAFMEIRKIIRTGPGNYLDNMYALFSNYKIDWLKKTKELCLSWNEIIELSKDELCTIGGHTHNHYVLSKLQPNEVISEIVKANTLLEKKIGKPIKHIAYPYGRKGEVGIREFNIVKNLGIKTATTTRIGIIHKEHKNHLECLPRIGLTFDFNFLTINPLKKIIITD